MRFRLLCLLLFLACSVSAQVQFFPPLQQTLFVIEGSPEGRVFMDVGILLVDKNSGKLWQKRTTRDVATGWVDVSAGSGGGGTGSALNFSDQFTTVGDTNIFLASGATVTNLGGSSHFSGSSQVEINLGTIANGGTATLVLSTNVSRAIYSGATATIALPAITITTNSYQLVHFGTNTSGGSQIITIPSLLREELGGTNLVTTITNNTGSGFSIVFRSVAGVWSRVYAIGDALTLASVPARKSYLKFSFARRVDGVGCTLQNTNDYTLNTFMVPRFSGTAATNANFCRFAVRVPKDFDITVAPLASLTTRLTAADTAARIYNIGFVSVANSAVSTATVGTWIILNSAADASGASDDVAGVSNVSLTGWTPTPGQWWVIELNRDGATDASTVASDLLELEIEYGSTQ